ncbi:hypothetical protein WISP_13985 [Willisornis vidua]|uniref:SUN domain-containing protein n=1 Tax=Willisornis vidua TaxID=1566151 RepID=A0ABQ9DR54_9PASS|nr:hypothetical protein WISP_13985 [Willisornis vidua]
MRKRRAPPRRRQEPPRSRLEYEEEVTVAFSSRKRIVQQKKSTKVFVLLFSVALGATIDTQRTSQTYDCKERWICRILRFFWTANPPDIILQPNVSPGRCWSFKGHQGQVVIRLPARVHLAAITVQHITKDVSPSGTVISAPRDIAVFTPSLDPLIQPRMIISHCHTLNPLNPTKTLNHTPKAPNPAPYVFRSTRLLFAHKIHSVDKQHIKESIFPSCTSCVMPPANFWEVEVPHRDKGSCLGSVLGVIILAGRSMVDSYEDICIICLTLGSYPEVPNCVIANCELYTF